MAPPRAARGSGAGSGSGGGADADARRVQELFHGVLPRCKNGALKDILSALSLKTYGRKEEMVVRVGEAVKYGADVERLQVVDGVVGKVGLGGSVGLALRELFPLVAWGERTRAGGEIEGNVDANGNANSNAARERDTARSERGVGATTSEKNHKQDTNDAGNTPAAPLTYTAIVRCMCKNKGVLPGMVTCTHCWTQQHEA